MPPIVIKQPTEFENREAYPEGACLRCSNCNAVRKVERFPDAPPGEQPDGVSPYCQGCDNRVRALVESKKLPPPRTRAEAQADMAAQMAKVPKESPVEEPKSVHNGRALLDDEDAGDQGEAQRADGRPVGEAPPADIVNSGQVTPGAQALLDADPSLDLKMIPGRESDRKVGVPEIEAHRKAKAAAEGAE